MASIPNDAGSLALMDAGPSSFPSAVRSLVAMAGSREDAWFAVHAHPHSEDNFALLPQAPYRCPATAFCLSCLLAGGGHLYSGETVKGAVLLGIAAAGLLGGALLAEGDGGSTYNPETFQSEPDTGRRPLYIGAGIAAASWIYGIVDSKSSAARMNTRNGFQVGGAGLETQPWVGLDRGSPSAGLRFRVTW